MIYENESQEAMLAQVLKDLGSINDQTNSYQTLENVFDQILIVISYIFYRFYEKPIMDLRDKN